MALLVTLGACGEDTGIDFAAPPPGPYLLTVQGDVDFQMPHGNQTLTVSVYSQNLGFLAGQQTVTISANEDPPFFLSFPRLLAEGSPYDVLFWIDSNDGGGTPGVCDPPEFDHQWSVFLSGPRGEIELHWNHDEPSDSDGCTPPVL